MSRSAECHPDRALLAKGLCENCYRKARRDADPEAARQSSRRSVAQWRSKNPKANPEKSATLAKAKKAKRRAAGRVKAADIRAAVQRQNGICFWCPTALEANFHADHYIPVAKGGTSDADNIVASCPRCNLSRRDTMPDVWIENGKRPS